MAYKGLFRLMVMAWCVQFIAWLGAMGVIVVLWYKLGYFNGI